MFRRFSVNFAVFSIILDLALVNISLVLAHAIRPQLSQLSFIRPIPGDLSLPWELYLAIGIVWLLVFLGSSIYDGRKNFRVIEELSTHSSAVLLSTVASAGILYLSYRDISRALFLTFVLLAGLLTGGWRLLYRLILRNHSNGNGKRRVLIVGTGESGQKMRGHIEENPLLGLIFVGFAGDKSNPHALGDYTQVNDLVREYAIDDIVLALPGEGNHRVGEIVAKLMSLPINIWVVPEVHSLALYRAGVETFAGTTMLDLRAPALNDYQRMTKRSLDLLGAILLLPFVLPIIFLTALAIYIFDSGPIFFNQPRAGQNGKPFIMHKFRTMVVDAEKISTPKPENHKVKNDPRITAIGRILRKTSLDELPQIFNILKGEMSFVGPRPELLDRVEQYEPWQRARFAVSPGITGWWQVNGRSDRPMHLNTEDDIYYLNNYSLLLDVQILLRTVWVVLTGRGAY